MGRWRLLQRRDKGGIRKAGFGWGLVGIRDLLSSVVSF